MKKSLFFNFLLFSSFVFAQSVLLPKVVKTHSNTDKFFYKINADSVNTEFLGEVEVHGFSNDDAKVFGMIYKKAKEVGANSFDFKPFEEVDGTLSTFDPSHYKLSLYYTKLQDFPKDDNSIYLLASSNKKQIISVNKDQISFEPRTFNKIKLLPGETYTISTRRLLGSTIKLIAQENQPVQYFLISRFAINANDQSSPGINFKSGDIIRLEQSYAQFLTTIYQEFKSKKN
jgi:hypothetical protein